MLDKVQLSNCLFTSLRKMQILHKTFDMGSIYIIKKNHNMFF